MTLDLFAGIAVRDCSAAVARYEGSPSFVPDDREVVWGVAPNRYLCIAVRPERAGHAMRTLFVKALFHDPDGDEIGFDGAPA